MPDSFLNNDKNLFYKIQRSLIPKSLPRMQEVEIASLCLPCDAIGGDLYDVIQISDDIIAFYILDISCQGLSSALISSMAKISFSDKINSLDSPELILERINYDLITNISSNFYITAFIGFLDLHNYKLTYCNAGHVYPIIYRKKENKILYLETPGVFLGVYKEAKFENRELYLLPEDIILLYSDGLLSLFRDKKDLLGKRKLESFILKENYKTPNEFIKNINKFNCEDVDNNKQIDDITAIVLEILTQSRRDKIKKELGFNEKQPIYLQYLSYYEEIDMVLANLLKDMDNTGYSNECIRKMKLTVTELLANAICHGNSDDHTKKVVMGYSVDEKLVMVSIMDEGKGFKLKDIPDPTLPENLIKDHGRGLFIVCHYVDEIDFNEKGNRVLIQKLRHEKSKN